MTFEAYRIFLYEALVPELPFDRHRSRGEFLADALAEIEGGRTGKWVIANRKQISEDSFYFCICLRTKTLTRHIDENAQLMIIPVDDLDVVHAVLDTKLQIVAITRPLPKQSFTTSWMAAKVLARYMEASSVNQGLYNVVTRRVLHDAEMLNAVKSAYEITSYAFHGAKPNPHRLRSMSGDVQEVAQLIRAERSAVIFSGKDLDKEQVLESLVENEKSGQTSTVWLRPTPKSRSQRVTTAEIPVSKQVQKITDESLQAMDNWIQERFRTEDSDGTEQK